MDEQTKRIIRVDMLKIVEEMLGKKHDDWDGKDIIKAMEIAKAVNDTKEFHLKKLNDTYFSITWEGFLKLALDYGFKLGYSKCVSDDCSQGKKVKGEEVILYYEKKGLILYARSYGFDCVHTAKLFGEIKADDVLSDEQWEALEGCSFSRNENGTISISVDVREGLKFYLDSLTEVFEFAKTWSVVPYMWLLNYIDTKKGETDSEKINFTKIKKSSPKVKKIIFG